MCPFYIASFNLLTLCINHQSKYVNTSPRKYWLYAHTKITQNQIPPKYQQDAIFCKPLFYLEFFRAESMGRMISSIDLWASIP